ncbi:OpgC domain-containing protein [Polaromonas glacialis]|uniref:OpgC domain-containing protein n=1 Tax=Polaromonas glacialis TaxID=866564 RepID=UPI000691BCF2|nr:OpgC domain-containing protein [Polaromonas glacialis]
MTRRWELDALRGLMLVLMTVTHLPTRLSSPLGQPFGYVSAAEGFVLLSAYMAGMVYGQMANRKGIDAMRLAFWRRALKVYACHAATLLFLFTVIAAVGLRIDEPAVKDLISYYLAHPLPALLAGLLLIYKPPLLDILPMYILFMLASPWVLAHGLRGGWRTVMAVSLGLWVLAQFGLGQWVYDSTVALTGLAVPFHETGAFSTFSWQFLWILGLWMGASRTEAAPLPFAFPRWAVALAVPVALACMVWRHAVGQAPFLSNASLNLLFDKWLLAPLRLLDLFALMVVTIRFGPALMRRMPRLSALETLGAASLPVFCAHLVVVLLVLAFFGADPAKHPVWLDALVVAASFAALYAVARLTVRLNAHDAAEKTSGPPPRTRAAGAGPSAPPS